MRLFTSLALVSCFALLSACAAETNEESGSSSDALTQAQGFAYIDALQVKLPADSNPSSNPIIGSVNRNTRLIVYCKAVNAGGTYLGSNVRSTLGISYVKDFGDKAGGGNMDHCLDADNAAIDCAALVTKLPACASSGSSSAGGASPTPATPPAGLTKLVPPASAHVLLVTKPTLQRAGYFNEPVSVHSAWKATFDIGAVWNAYDSSHRIIGQSTCREDRSFSFDGDPSRSLVFDCWGSVSSAVEFEVVYYATGPAAAAARL